MRGREPIVPQRRRRIPAQFSWVDHRLVREGHIRGHSAEALALFFCALAVLFFGIFPNEGILPLPLLDWAGASAASLFVP